MVTSSSVDKKLKSVVVKHEHIVRHDGRPYYTLSRLKLIFIRNVYIFKQILSLMLFVITYLYYYRIFKI